MVVGYGCRMGGVYVVWGVTSDGVSVYMSVDAMGIYHRNDHQR